MTLLCDISSAFEHQAIDLVEVNLLGGAAQLHQLKRQENQSLGVFLL